MRHAPADSALLEIARDQQLGFVRMARFFPNTFVVCIAPSEHVLNRVESIDHMMRSVAGEASRKSVTTGCGVVKNSGFGDGFGHGRILPRRTILFHRPANFALAAATAPVLSPIPASDLKPSNGAFAGPKHPVNGSRTNHLVLAIAGTVGRRTFQRRTSGHLYGLCVTRPSGEFSFRADKNKVIFTMANEKDVIRAACSSI
jgi:hypothetical protein